MSSTSYTSVRFLTKSLLFAGAVFFAALNGCSSDRPTEPSTNTTSLAYQVEHLTTAFQIPGAIGALWTRDGITDIRAAGIRRVGHPDKMTVEDYMHMGSLTKFMTATMIGKLIDEGTLAWNTRPIDAFPDLAATLDSGYRDITLIDLLRHRAGVPATEDYDSIPHLIGNLRQQREQVVHLALSAPPAVPRGAFHYSNVGYVIAAAMAEKVTNDDWRDLMQQKLFDPLNMTPAFGWPIAHSPSEPWGHEKSGSGFVAVDSSVDTPLGFLEPAGFVSLTLQDYSTFIRLHMDAIAGSPSLLSAATFDSLRTPIGEDACGVKVISTPSGALYWHNGSNGYFYSVFYLLPDENLGLIMTSNAGDTSLFVPVGQAAEAVLEPLIAK